MPRNGSGVASAPPGTTATPNTTILSSAHNSLKDDIYSLMNTAWPVSLGGTGGTSAQTSVASLLNGTTYVLDSSMRIAAAGDTTKLVDFDASGITTATTVTIKVANGQPTYGQCKLALDGSSLKLTPCQGNLLTINGYGHPVPSAGITLAATGLTPGTLYYIYAYMNSGTLTLEASTTTHATDATTGVEIKSGDATRTLVGVVEPVTGPAFQDSPANRLVRSYFNRTPVGIYGPRLGTVATSTSTSFAEVSSSLRARFITWADEDVFLSSAGWVYNASAEEASTAVSLDGDTATAANRSLTSTVFNSAGGPCVTSGAVSPSEGAHYITLIGAVSGGTGVWQPTSGVRDGVCVTGLIG